MSLWMTWHNLCSWEWPLAQKLVLPKKDMTWWTVIAWACNKERANCWISANVSPGKDTDKWIVSQHNPKKQKVWVRWRLDLEKLICNPRQINKKHKNEQALLSAHLEQTRTKMSSKQITIWKLLWCQRNRIGLVRVVKNPLGCGQHNRWNLPLIYYILCQTNCKINDDDD